MIAVADLFKHKTNIINTDEKIVLFFAYLAVSVLAHKRWSVGLEQLVARLQLGGLGHDAVKEGVFCSLVVVAHTVMLHK